MTNAGSAYWLYTETTKDVLRPVELEAVRPPLDQEVEEMAIKRVSCRLLESFLHDLEMTKQQGKSK